MSKKQISSCPFCGHDECSVESVNNGQFAVWCPECGASGPVCEENFRTKEYAIELWNRRLTARLCHFCKRSTCNVEYAGGGASVAICDKCLETTASRK